MLTGKDLIIRNANIITMNPKRPFSRALAVKEGRIAAVGSWEEVKPHTEGAPVLDLKGKTVVPGMIDTHVHFLWTALNEAALDVSGAENHETLRVLVQNAVAETPPGEAFLGMGYTEYALDTTRFSPIIDVLDEAAPEVPVYLIGVSGHSSAVNTRALAMLDFPSEVPGIFRDEAGRPNGLLANKANNLAFDLFHQLLGLEKKAESKIPDAIRKAHSVGITTLHALEGSPEGDDMAVGAFWNMIPDLPLRFVLYYQTLDVDKVVELGLPRIGGCILLDGDVGPRTAALSEPYVDAPDCYGTLYYSQEEIDTFTLEAHRTDLQIAFHAVGDAAVEQALNAFEKALGEHPREDHRHRIEHCEVIREEQIQRAQELGVALAIQPPFNHFWPHETYFSSLGEPRAWQVDPVRTLLRPGLLVAGGSDSTVTPMGPLVGVHAAVNHSNAMERVGVHEAFQLYTTHAARIAFQEDDRGSLEVGKLGDLVVLGDDLYAVDPRTIKDIPVEMTVIGGEVVYQT
jgi:predicted amidohydrolase YtcJ